MRLLDSPLELSRAWAAEAIGKGFAIWREHLADGSGGEVQNAAAVGPASTTELIKLLFMLSVSHAEGSQVSKPAQSEAQPKSGVSLGSRNVPNPFQVALMAVGVSEPRLFCSIMGEYAVSLSVIPFHRMQPSIKTNNLLTVYHPLEPHASTRPLFDPNIAAPIHGYLCDFASLSYHISRIIALACLTPASAYFLGVTFSIHLFPCRLGVLYE